MLRGSLAVLYAGRNEHALRVTAAIFEYTYHNRILSAISSSQLEQKDLWEAVLYAMLSGVLVSPFPPTDVTLLQHTIGLS